MEKKIVKINENTLRQIIKEVLHSSLLNEDGRYIDLGDFMGHHMYAEDDSVYGWTYYLDGDSHYFNSEEELKKYIIELNKQQQMRVVAENVYVNGISGKKALLTYNDNSRSVGNKNSADYLKTSKMEQNNADTYEVKLKNGLTCYNITSIKGLEVMHYFKRLWDGSKSYMKFKDKKGEENQYELTMLENEKNNFMRRFQTKVNYVVNYFLANKCNTEDIDGMHMVSIYPVPSSSNFNEKMADELSQMSVAGLPVQKINSAILKKDLSDLQRDDDFIEKNKDFFNGKISRDSNDSVLKHVDNDIEKLRSLQIAKKYIPEINNITRQIITQYYQYNIKFKKNIEMPRMIKSMSENYKKLCDLKSECIMSSRYDNKLRGGTSSIAFNNIASALKSSKGPSDERRSDEIWQLVKPHLKGEVSPITNKPYAITDIVYYEEKKFEIKNLTNGERMGLKNIYNTNTEDAEMVQNELNKINGTLFIIFDDNISGGATLSDVCYQCQKMGIKNILPITFGEMEEKWQYKKTPLIHPSMVNGHAEWNS